MTLVTNPASENLDMGGKRVRNTAQSCLDNDYVRRDELQGLILAAAVSALFWRRDNQNKPLANLDMDGRKFTNAAAATAAQEFMTKAQVDAIETTLTALVNGIPPKLGLRGFAFLQQSGGQVLGVTGMTLTGPGPYSLTVPADVRVMEVEICGAGGGGVTDGYTALGGSASSITGSTSHLLVEAKGGAAGAPGVGGAGGAGSTGSTPAWIGEGGDGGDGGSTTSFSGGGGPGWTGLTGYTGATGSLVSTPTSGGRDQDRHVMPWGWGGTGGWIVGSGACGGGGGGGGYGRGMIAVVPGETLTIHIGEGGASTAPGLSGSLGSRTGGHGFVRLSW